MIFLEASQQLNAKTERAQNDLGSFLGFFNKYLKQYSIERSLKAFLFPKITYSRAMKTESQRLGSQRLKELDLPPEEILRQLLIKMEELSGTRFAGSAQANARLLSLNKLARSGQLVLRSLLDTNEHHIESFRKSQEAPDV